MWHLVGALSMLMSDSSGDLEINCKLNSDRVQVLFDTQMFLAFKKIIIKLPDAGGSHL
jgi:hypothetical protein